MKTISGSTRWGPGKLAEIPEVRVFTFFRVFPCREINCFLVLVFITNFDQFFLKFFTREARKKLVVLWCFWVHFEVHARGNNSETVCALFSWSVKNVANDTLNKNCNTGCSEKFCLVWNSRKRLLIFDAFGGPKALRMDRRARKNGLKNVSSHKPFFESDKTVWRFQKLVDRA